MADRGSDASRWDPGVPFQQYVSLVKMRQAGTSVVPEKQVAILAYTLEGSKRSIAASWLQGNATEATRPKYTKAGESTVPGSTDAAHITATDLSDDVSGHLDFLKVKFVASDEFNKFHKFQ